MHLESQSMCGVFCCGRRSTWRSRPLGHLVGHPASPEDGLWYILSTKKPDNDRVHSSKSNPRRPRLVRNSEIVVLCLLSNRYQ
ncbi:hypothetical protein BD289DRAFT_432728 [Coniella lustricola]|uniref:Uncharacterized protein n=1 Tax=Coniella lustricola TaxID=2025994 RepID=A0A2T3A9G3_9PEZI|nr:hypothetical protein BD289DRAFT_432728 [Coniella lustricola]